MDARLNLNPNEARVLMALLNVDKPLSGRAVARIAELSQSTSQRTLIRLREVGLVATEAAPPALLYRLNRDHLAMPALSSLLRIDDELRVRAGEQIAGWRLPPLSALIYGSFARRALTADSDIDVLLVRPDAIQADDATWQEQVADLTDQVQRWTGRRASVIDMSLEEAAAGMVDREPFLVQADKDGWLLAGQRLRELAGARA
jgi:predicted nucleotidyltransferase